MIATGTALIFTGWVMISPGKCKRRVGGFTLAMAWFGCWLIVVGMAAVIQARN